MITLLLFTLLFATESKIPGIAITGKFAKIEGSNIVFHLDEVFQIEHNIPVIDPRLAKNDKEAEWIKLSNLEAKWLTGKRYVSIRGVKTQITLAQEVEILLYQARRAHNSKNAMTDDERAYLELKMQDVRSAVEKRVESDLYDNKFKAKTIITSHNAQKAVGNALANSGNVYTLILDGLPYFLTDLSTTSAVQYDLSSKTIKLKSDLGLTCSLPTTLPANNNVKVKLDSYYANVAWSSLNIPQGLVMMDTTENLISCSEGVNTADRIFASGLEANQ